MVPNDQMGFVFEEFIGLFYEDLNEKAREFYTPRDAAKACSFEEGIRAARPSPASPPYFPCFCTRATAASNPLCELRLRANLQRWTPT